MKPPCEVAIKDLLPLIRALVAKDLKAKGLSQAKIAEMVGVTQPAVSGYLKQQIDKNEPLYSEEVVALSKWLASGLASGNLSYSEAVKGICTLCTTLKCQGSVCTLHKLRFPSLQAEGCDICIQLYSKGLPTVDKRYVALSNLKAALNLIHASKEFSEVIPEVLVNIVEATPNAKSVKDVAGIPGRISKVEGMPRAFMPPEFGASEHLASVLLAAMRVNPDVRAAINIAYNRFVRGAFTKLGFSVYIFDRRETPTNANMAQTRVIEEVLNLGKRGEPLPEVFVDAGGYWIEPSAYIFGSNAVEVAQKAIKVAEEVARLKSK
ncbi:MAG: thiamine-phosphate synthase family protein [Nitrososphaerales archaeon]